MRRSARALTRPVPALLLVTAAGLLARLWALGWRVAHQDEGRVASWILHYMQTGRWEYRAIIHGPFLPHVEGVLFSVLGPSDFTMRLAVAVVGGLLPLVALLFRSRLRDVEVIGAGLFLAANPVLLYYSRFMRNDVLLAAFALAAVGFAVRAVDTGDPRYTYGVAVAYALALTTKENALVYLIAWAGALVLVADHRVLRARAAGEAPVAAVWGTVRPPLRTLWSWRRHLLGAVVAGAAVVVAFYAPLPDLYVALTHPTRLPGVVDAATVGTVDKFSRTWASHGLRDHPYLPFLGHFVDVQWRAALPVSVFAVVGFLVTRYGDGPPRPLVAFAFYWGAASVVGYPLIIDISAAWSNVHAIVPLAVPAAVGLGLVVDAARSALDSGDRVAVGAAAVLLVAPAALTAGVAYDTTYRAPQSPDNPLVQYAQPSGEMQSELATIRRVSREHAGGPDVLFYGHEFYSANETWAAGEDPPSGWFARLPLPWYLDSYGAEVTSTTDAETLARMDDAEKPPVVVALGAGANVDQTAADVAPQLEGYDRTERQGYLHGRPVVFFVRSGAAGE
ncbi:MAG: flippase activity-associated protein Agl23 [Halobacteriaceae archaeon]